MYYVQNSDAINMTVLRVGPLSVGEGTRAPPVLMDLGTYKVTWCCVVLFLVRCEQNVC